MQFYTGFPLL